MLIIQRTSIKRLLILYLCIAVKTVQADEPHEVVFPVNDIHTVHDQISNLNVQAFCQDSLGYMWIATLRGLNRYNGYEFIHYFHDKNDSLSLGDDFVISLFLDSSHRLWIGTSTGVNRYDFTSDSFIKYPASRETSYIFSFYEDHQHKIWVGTNTGPGWIDTLQNSVILDANIKQTVNIYMEDNKKRLWMGVNGNMGLAYTFNADSWKYLTVPGNRSVISMYNDPQGLWWLGTNNGLILFDPITQSFNEPPEAFRSNPLFNHSHINFIKEISPIQLLIGTISQGFFHYDILTQTLQHNKPQQLSMSGSNHLMSCYIDRQENVWTGSFDKGFSVWKRYLDYFNRHIELSNAFNDKFVTRISEDKYGNLWISTRDHGLFCYTRTGKLKCYDAQNSNLFQDNNFLIESLFIDSKNRIWIGLSEELLLGKITDNGQLTVLSRKQVNELSKIMNEDKNGQLWVGTVSGLYRLTTENEHVKMEKVHTACVLDICVLSSGDILFSSYGTGIFRIPASGGKPERVWMNNSDAELIAGRCCTIFEDSQQQIWLGSYGNGLLCLSKDHCRIFTRNNGLPSNDVLCFREDRQGEIWMSTLYGISRYRAADSCFVNYFGNDGTQGNQFHEKGGLRHSDGRIFFTGNHGLTFFDPAIMLPNKFPPKIHLTDLKIMNHSVVPAAKGSVLRKNIAYTTHITLNHKHSVVSFDYTGIDFLVPEKLNYAYKLEGFDKNWNKVGTIRRASYSNLSPGRYTFLVKAVNGDGIESQYPATLHITVKPAPWFSWPAIMLYVIFLTAITVWLFRLLFRMKVNKQLLEMEHSEREREKQVVEMKMNFFTNISHELRTPLTLISAPLEQLLMQKSLDQPNRKLLTTISRNVQRLLRLMNQLLDFRKMESGMLALRVSYADIIPCILSIQEIFNYQAIEKQITLTFEPHTARQEMWVDFDKLEKILHNLLSNALKYTPQNRSVDVFTQELTAEQTISKYPALKDTKCTMFIEITVSDTGSGIPDDKLGELFIQYRQIKASSDSYTDYGGSGIGLYYCKRLAEAHYGAISAINQIGGGMAFSFILPLDDIYTDDEKEINTTSFPRRRESPISSISPISPTSLNKGINPLAINKHAYTVLIVEDNIELMAFIRTILETTYTLLYASDGDEAWNITQDKSPDLILSDVLMPGISGYRLCKQVKQHPALCHIPVILLTAKSAIEDQIEGLEQGVDAYICKPFHVDHLLRTIANLLKNRETLRRYFLTPLEQGVETTPVILNKMDQVFLDKLTQLLELELENSELNINTIARNMGFSRTAFYRKIKGLTDMSPLDFLRNYCSAPYLLDQKSPVLK